MMQDKIIDKLRFQYSQDGDNWVMGWLGESSAKFPHLILEPYFVELIGSLSSCKSFILDFREFEYMNSSTVQPIMHLIRGLNTLNIPITVVYSKDKKWQVLSFQTFRAIAHILKNISVEGR